MARLERIRVYPVKSLDGIDLEAVRVLEGGTLDRDREFVLRDADGEAITAKRTAAVHSFDADFDPQTAEIAVAGPDGDRQRFDLETVGERERAAAWFGDALETDLTIERDRSTGYVDRPEMGPSVISTATLETVASWFEGVTVDGVRRRLRANLEVSGVPAFWEDRFVGASAPSFTVGDVALEGVTPCARCVVPERDPDTGEALPEFRQRFLEKRRETFPAFADEEAFDHYYTLMLIARVREADRGSPLRVGAPVEVVDE